MHVFTNGYSRYTNVDVYKSHCTNTYWHILIVDMYSSLSASRSPREVVFRTVTVAAVHVSN